MNEGDLVETNSDFLEALQGRCAHLALWSIEQRDIGVHCSLKMGT